MVFRNIPEPRNARITYVYIAIRKIAVVNHWAVILEIDNGKYYVNTQKNVEKNNKNILLDYFYSLKSAAEDTLKLSYDSAIFLSRYGSCNYNWEKFYNELNPKDSYVFFFDDCQNYCRRIVKLLTGKTVGLWPIEDGPVYNNNFPTNDQIAKQIRSIDNPVGQALAGTLVFANPCFWLAKGIFSLFD